MQQVCVGSCKIKLIHANYLKEFKYILIEEIEGLKKELTQLHNPLPGVSSCDMRKNVRYASSEDFRILVEDWLKVFNEIESKEIQLNLISSYVYKLEDLNVGYQSGEVAMASTGIIDNSVVVEHDTLTEIGGAETQTISSGNYQTTAIKSSHELAEFFRRPVQIFSVPFAVGVQSEYSIKPFDLYLADPAVRAKLRNFAFLKAKVGVRIAVSGNPFDAGRIMTACYPWANTNEALAAIWNVGAPGVGTAWDKLKLQYMSQSKFSTVIDMKENKPVDFVLPWISPMPVGRLYNNSSSAVASGAVFNDFSDMWRLYIKVLNPLSSVTSTPTPAYMYVYAYLEDVEIGIPTASQMTITTQSDERKTGPIESTASALLGISSSLENAPYIGLYARASSFALAGIRGIASLFGWSAPVMTTAPSRVKNEPFQNGANYIQMDTGQRLVLDPKQELAISTEYVGCDEDELLISSLVGKQVFFNTFTWPAATNPLVNMYNYAIHPRLTNCYTTTTTFTRIVVPTPLDMVAQLTTKWRGKIVLTFEVVCTSYHRGKLLITYDPNIYQYTNIVTNTNLNKQYSHIWDIQETQRYSICIEWNFPRAWANNLSDANCYALHGASLTPSDTLLNAVNGFVSIAPLTKLQSPDSSNVVINTYIHGEDMHFNRLSEQFMTHDRRIVYNSSEEKVSNVPESCISINEDALSSSDVYDHFYGERIVSLRSLFKRFWVSGASNVSGLGTNKHITISNAIIPENFTNVGTTHSLVCVLNHVRQSFLVMRGSFRKRLTVFTDAPVNFSPTLITLRGDESSFATSTTVDTSVYTTGHTNGTLMYAMNTNCGIEMELPFYNNNYFAWAGSDDPFLSAGPVDYSLVCRGYDAHFYPSGTPTAFEVVEYTATGEDFQLSYFTGCAPYVSV